MDTSRRGLRRLGLRLLNRGCGGLEADLRVRAVAERLRRRAAAAAERLLHHRDRISLHVGEGEVALHEVRAVVFDLDVNRHSRQNTGFCAVMCWCQFQVLPGKSTGTSYSTSTV